MKRVHCHHGQGMQAFFQRLIIVVMVSTTPVVLSACHAQPARKKDTPVLGTWTVTLQGLPARLVFTKQEGRATVGYFEMSPAGSPQKAVAIVSAVTDPSSRAVRLVSREIHTNLPAVVQMQVEGVLGPMGKKIDKMKSLTHPTGPQGLAQWKDNATPPSSLPTVAASLADNSDRSLLYKQCSSDFLVNEIRLVHAPVRPLLEQLEKSNDSHLKSLAQRRRLFQDFFELATTQETAARLSQTNEVLAELGKQLGKAFEKDRPGIGDIENQVSKFMNSGAMKNIFKSEQRAVLMAFMREATTLIIEQEIKADFAARNAPALDKAASLRTGLKVDGNGFGSITIRNETGKDLHHCVIAPRLRIDPAKMKTLEKEFRTSTASLKDFTKKFGIDMSISDTTNEYVILYHRLDKGSVNYLSEWKQGATVQMEMAQPDAIQRIGQSISVWVGCDEGVADRPIDITGARNDLVMQQPKELHVLDLGSVVRSHQLAFSPNGKWLVSAGQSPQAFVWDAVTGRAKGRFDGLGAANTVAFHPQQSMIAVGDQAGRIHLVSLDTMKEIRKLQHIPQRELRTTGSSVEAVAFSKDGKLVASASADRTVKLWNVSTGQIVATLEHPASVRTLAFSPDGTTLATGASDSAVRLWSVAKKEKLATFEGHKTPVVVLAYHPDGKTLASGGMDGLVKFWTLADGKNPSDLMTNARYLSIAYSPDGKRFAAGGDQKGVMILDPESGNTLVTMPTAMGPVAFSRDGKLASGWRESSAALPKAQVKLWQLPR